ncbi:preprotein translocase subunit SecE [Candidatus Gracilibacteria bacterium]|nr:preprotein translocase subunit SecE [Candidatus Gracilibacteria bacterium]
MIQFFKDSVRELRHVVWPTPKETRDFFFLVLLILTLFTIYLFIFSNIFSQFILWLNNVI